MRPRETILSALPKNDCNKVKVVITASKIQVSLKAIYEGDKHVKSIKLQNWILLFQEGRMMEVEFFRTYVGIISHIFA